MAGFADGITQLNESTFMLASALKSTGSKFIEGTIDIGNDPKKIGGILLVVLGFLLVHSVQAYDFYELTLRQSIIKGATTVAGSISMFSGAAAFTWKSLSSRRMKQIDLAWMMASSIGIALALAQNLLAPAEEYRSTIEKNMVRSRQRAAFHLENSMRTYCSNGQLDKDTCQWMWILYGDLREGAEVSEFYIEKICPKPPITDVAKMKPGLINPCMDFYGSVLPAKLKVMQDRENMENWKRYGFLFPIFMSLAVGIRVSKSVAELWLMDDTRGR